MPRSRIMTPVSVVIGTLALGIGGITMPRTGVAQHQNAVPADTAVIAGLARQLVPLRGVEAGAPFDDLAAFGRAVGNARLVALGEATHGTREVFQMKHRLLEYLVKEKGFTVFAIEASWPLSEVADRYVKRGEGDPRDALRKMGFWTWQTEEVVALLEWMRAFNAAPGAHPILSFSAFDMQDYRAAFEALSASLNGTPEGAIIGPMLPGLLPPPTVAWRDSVFYRPAADRADSVVAALERTGTTARTLQLALVLAQGLRSGTMPFKSRPDIAIASTFRDQMMARNVQWLLDVAYPGENIVLWAHNAHVDMSHDVSLIRYGGGPAKRPMGSWLREALGTQMYVLGFAIDSGRARARRTINGIVSGPVDYPLPSPAPANLVLRAAGSPMFFLDLKRATGPLRAWLQAPLDFLEFGAGWTDEVKWWPGRRLAEAFDGLIYLKHTTASRLIEGALCSGAPCRQ